MRNLKKILALVLALVMSLSLMATASAASFPDVADDNAYKTAIDVLNGVKVFQGYNDGAEFRPTGEITRAEVAAIIYRISTGDVTDSQKDIYTAWNGAGKLSDVTTGWYAGYVNFCSNAGYIKGYPDGTFKASNKVTGYEVLAMILRAVGYGRNGEFSGSGWAITVGSLAETLGITKNVREPLGSPATRQMVAEILFRAIFTETQKYNALYMYEGTGTNLAKENLGLERITGVVMANEWANINENADEVLANGNTEMLVDGKTMTLKTSSELDAVGLTYNAYVQNETDVIGELEMSDVNKVAFNEGAEIDVTKLAKKESLSTGSALFFLDYDEDYYNLDKSDYLVRYAIAKDSCGTAWTNYMSDIDGKDGHTVTERTITVAWDENGDDVVDANDKVVCWVVSIRPDNDITETDVEIMKEIFYSADRIGDKHNDDGLRDYAVGEVYIGTSSLVDQSDELSWKQFVEKYFSEGTRVSFTGCNNGESLRVVDNNGDGKAEYVFKVEYWQDRAVDTYKDTLEFNTLRLSRYTDDNRVVFDDIVVGDVVNYSVIDGKLRLWKADVITDTIQTKNFKNETVTPANGEEMSGSGIYNETDLDEDIMVMNEKVEYNIYLDEFGYIRTYELAQGSKYALLTEMYSNGNQNFNYVQNNRWIAEVTAGDAKTEEYVVANGKTPFASKFAWTNRINNYNSNYNFLQPAVAHLDNWYNSALKASYYVGATGGNGEAAYKEWNRGVLKMLAREDSDYGVFDYGTANSTPVADHSFSFTNVASYTMDGDNVVLNTAAKLATDKSGNQLFYKLEDGKYVEKDTIAGWAKESDTTETAVKAAIGTTYFPVYAVDYVQLERTAVEPGMRHFSIDDNYGANYNTTYNGYVNAVVDTEFYVVEDDSIRYYDSYKDLPTIKAENVRAAYAVATNTGADANTEDYWVADVIVIETSGIEKNYDSISLMYYNPYETTGRVRYVDSLNNEWRAYQPDSDDEAKITVSGATGSWGNTSDSWNEHGYGFYALYDSEYADGGLDTDTLKYIDEDWNEYGIYAGTLIRHADLTSSRYFDVDTLGRYDEVRDDKYVVAVDYNEGDYQVPIYRVSEDADNLRVGVSLKNTDIKNNDELIWVYNRAQNKVAFIIDLGARTKDVDGFKYEAPEWLSDVYDAILDEQQGAVVTKTIMPIELNLADGEKMTLTYNGTKYGPFTGAGTFTANIPVADDVDLVDIGITAEGGATAAAIIPAPGWTKVSASTTSLRLGRQDNALAVGLSARDSETPAAAVYTVAAAVAKIDEIKTAAEAGGLTATELEAATELLSAIKANLIPSEALTTAGLTDKIDEAASAVGDATPAVVATLASTDENVTLPEETEITLTNGAGTFEIEVTEGYTPAADGVTFTEKEDQADATEGKVIWTGKIENMKASATVTITATEDDANTDKEIVASVAISAAKLEDQTEGEGKVDFNVLNPTEYKAELTETAVKVTHPSITAHKNAENKDGKWVGFQVALTSEDKNDWTHVTYKWKGREVASGELETLPNGAKGIAFYYDAATEIENGDTVEVTFTKGSGETAVSSTKVTYTVTFDVKDAVVDSGNSGTTEQ